MHSTHDKICRLQTNRAPLRSMVLVLMIIIGLYNQTVHAQSETPFEMMEVHLFDATDGRHDNSMFASSLSSVATKFSRLNILTVVDVNATQAEMKAAMQSGKTIALFVGSHGSADGVLVDGRGYGVRYETFTTYPSPSVRVIECAGCNGEKVARSYPVPAGVKLRHGEGKRLGFQLVDDFRAFPDAVEKELQNRGNMSTITTSMTSDPYAKSYPNGDIYVLEQAFEAGRAAGSGSVEPLIGQDLYNKLIAKASRAGYRVLIYRGGN